MDFCPIEIHLTRNAMHICNEYLEYVKKEFPFLKFPAIS